MSYLLINGSPRGKTGNSYRIIETLRDGINDQDGGPIQTLSLLTPKEREVAVKALVSAKRVILVFPLYTDAMPGIVMAFIEELSPYQHALNKLKLGFIVHSGFPEAKQSRAIARYLLRLPTLLGATCLGTAICAGSMALRANRLDQLFCVGQLLVLTDSFDNDVAKNLSLFEQLPRRALIFMRMATKLPFMQHSWILQLKKNGVYKDRNATPYAPDTVRAQKSGHPF